MFMQPGTQIIGNRYILHDQLGAGGMGAVHRPVIAWIGE